MKGWRFWNKKDGGEELPVHDLDAIVAKPMPFLLHGKRREIVPVDVERFLELANALAYLKKQSEAGAVTTESLIDAYFGLFKSVIKPISHDDVRRMTQAQVTGTFMLILGRMQGDNEQTIEASVNEASKKKTISSRP